MVGRLTDHQPSIRVDHSELLVRRVGWIYRDKASSTWVIVPLDEQVPRHPEKRLCEPIGLDGVLRFQVPHEPLGVCQQVLFVHLCDEPILRGDVTSAPGTSSSARQFG